MRIDWWEWIAPLIENMPLWGFIYLNTDHQNRTLRIKYKYWYFPNYYESINFSLVKFSAIHLSNMFPFVCKVWVWSLSKHLNGFQSLFRIISFLLLKSRPLNANRIENWLRYILIFLKIFGAKIIFLKLNAA